MEDFATISSHCSVYAVSDDYTGMGMTNPLLDNRFRKVSKGRVILGRHTIVGSHSVIMPACELHIGAAVGAMSIVNRSLEGWKIYAGIPCRVIRNRRDDVLMLERNMIKE